MSPPRIVIAGLRGGGGKTLVAAGLAAALRRRGLRVAAFKKGPDYIDAAWLARAAGTDCRNLDLVLMPPEAVVRSFNTAAAAADAALIEGNRGLFDGVDAQGTSSTAALARLLDCPVALVVDCTKATRTVAALVLGCQEMTPGVSLGGVILNQLAGSRHESVVRQSIQNLCGLPVLGAVPRLREDPVPQRHLGLVPPDEHDAVGATIRRLGQLAERYLDLDAILAMASRRQTPDTAPHTAPDASREGGDEGPSQAPALGRRGTPGTDCPPPRPPSGPVRIGVFRDAAFQFYYPENLEALARHGGCLVPISPLADTRLPDVHALYIGGGFPETLAPALAANRPFHQALRQAVEAGLPVYAECGGAVYLGQELAFHGNRYPMAGVLPAAFAFHTRPQGHGYTELETVRQNPFYSVGQVIRGHEFHYTTIEPPSLAGLAFAFRVRRGRGYDGRHDGLGHRNVLALYTHVHALGTPAWAPSLVQAGTRFQAGSQRNPSEEWNAAAHTV